MSASALVKTITVSDGTTVALPESGVVLFVGSNNVGKSQALRDISKLVREQNQVGLVVTAVEVEYRGTPDDLIAQLRSDRTILRSGVNAGRIRMGDGSLVEVSVALEWWSGGAQQYLGKYFLLHADTESRLEASRPTGVPDLFHIEPSHPLHSLYLRRDIETRLNAISHQAFDEGLVLDIWTGGSQWALRVGEIAQPDAPRPDQMYLDAIQGLPLLHDQGDGMRSMIGLLLNLTTSHQTISLVDEPEAFLHPPQARFLAKLLSQDSEESGRAVFLSTHSSDIVHGILEGSAPTTVIRLRRNGNVNEAAVLSNEAVRRLWSDPLLRYSNLLEGLFTDVVIVCESDADCKFFASIRDTIPPVDSRERRPDVLFVSCGGKSRMHVGVEALRAASVPVAVIGDFDVLNNWGTLSRLILKAGGTVSEFEADWRILNSALTSDTRTASVAGMKEAVVAAFDSMAEVSRKALDPVREALKIENGWDRVKNAGLSGVPKADAYNAAKRLLDGLKSLQIHLIPVGEMEDFVPEIGGHGPSWVADVLESRLHEGSDADGARDFFSSVMGSIAH